MLVIYFGMLLCKFFSISLNNKFKILEKEEKDREIAIYTIGREGRKERRRKGKKKRDREREKAGRD